MKQKDRPVLPEAVSRSLTKDHLLLQPAQPADGVQPAQPPPLPAIARPPLCAANTDIVRVVLAPLQFLHTARSSAWRLGRSNSNVALQSLQ
jgi:hypothetical protein